MHHLCGSYGGIPSPGGFRQSEWFKGTKIIKIGIRWPLVSHSLVSHFGYFLQDALRELKKEYAQREHWVIPN